jgi:hypothetical protein
VTPGDAPQKADEPRPTGSSRNEEPLDRGSSGPTGERIAQSLSSQLAEARDREELARSDLAWEIEREKHYIGTGRNGKRVLPSTRASLRFILAGVICGVLAAAPFVSPLLLNLLFNLLPSVFIPLWMFFGLAGLVCTCAGMYQLPRAWDYEQALAAYQSRRGRIRCEADEELAQVEADSPAVSDPPATESVAQGLSDRIAEARYQTELARLDREWEVERQKHYVTMNRGARFLPDKPNAVGTAVVGVVFGVVMVLTHTPAFFPYLGVPFALLGIAGGMRLYSLASEYERAVAAYQSRRKSLRPDQFRP